MKKESRMDYVESVYKRYRQSPKSSKTKILDELCNVCKYNRSTLSPSSESCPIGPSLVQGRSKTIEKYDHQVLGVIEKVWKAANYPWSLRLKEILRLWLPWIRKHYRTTPEIEAKLLSISPSTIDRALKDKKRNLNVDYTEEQSLALYYVIRFRFAPIPGMSNILVFSRPI